MFLPNYKLHIIIPLPAPELPIELPDIVLRHGAIKLILIEGLFATKVFPVNVESVQLAGTVRPPFVKSIYENVFELANPPDTVKNIFQYILFVILHYKIKCFLLVKYN